jgi:phage shock protein PspC (stress-responsive transcriptional regulator)
VLCIHCSRAVDADSAFFRFCGTAAREPSANPRRLTRLPDDGRIAGVCAGIAAYLRTDVTFVRLAWVILSIWPGALVFGAIAYVVAWIIVPAASATESRAATSSRARLFRSRTDRKLGGVPGGLAAWRPILAPTRHWCDSRRRSSASYLARS